MTAAEAAPQLSAYGKPTSFSGGVPSGSRPLVYPCCPLQFPATAPRSISTTRGAASPAAARARALAAIAIPFGPAPTTANVGMTVSIASRRV